MNSISKKNVELAFLKTEEFSHSNFEKDIHRQLLSEQIMLPDDSQSTAMRN